MKSTSSIAKENSLPIFLYLGWFAIAFFYFYQYILRVAPGVLVTDLRDTFHLTAVQFSTLGSFYLYAYSICQIPLGVIVDYIGIRKSVIGCIFLCLIGSLLLAYSPTLAILQLSRVLVGIGSAAAFMCALKLVVDYMPVGKRGFLMGATLTLGTFGALVAGKPLVLLDELIGWRHTILYTSYLGLTILLVAILFLPHPRKERLQPLSSHTLQDIIHSLIKIFKIRPIMIYAVLAIGVYTPLSVVADLWGVSFLMQKYNLVRQQAAGISMMMYFGLGLGCLLLPWLSERHGWLNRGILISVFGVLGIFALLLYGPLLSPGILTLILTSLGIFCGAEVLCFAGASQFTHTRNVGTTLGLVNTFNMLGGGLLQQAVGWILDKVWTGSVSNTGIHLYSTYDYTLALSIIFIVIIVCCVLSFYLPKDKASAQRV